MKVSQRGQALFETAAFLPLMLLVMLSIIYFSKLGVLQTRAVEAVRYASMVTNGSQAAAKRNFTIEQMYAELHRQAAVSASSPPVNTDPCEAPVSGSDAKNDAKLALYQQQAAYGASPATAPPYFVADSTPAPTCVDVQVRLGASNAARGNYASGYYTVEVTGIDAAKNAPAWLTSIGVPHPNVDAMMGYPQPPSPARMLYCSPNFAAQLAVPIAQDEPSATEGSKYNFPTPLPTSGSPTIPTPRPGC